MHLNCAPLENRHARDPSWRHLLPASTTLQDVVLERAQHNSLRRRPEHCRYPRSVGRPGRRRGSPVQWLYLIKLAGRFLLRTLPDASHCQRPARVSAGTGSASVLLGDEPRPASLCGRLEASLPDTWRFSWPSPVSRRPLHTMWQSRSILGPRHGGICLRRFRRGQWQ
jgi:hypothetical protein